MNSNILNMISLSQLADLHAFLTCGVSETKTPQGVQQNPQYLNQKWGKNDILCLRVKIMNHFRVLDCISETLPITYLNKLFSKVWLSEN